MSQSETSLSVECQQNRHSDCQTQTSCVCTCHDPLTPGINPNEEQAPR